MRSMNNPYRGTRMETIDNEDKSSKPWQFQPGNKASPGRPKGARSRLQENFLAALADDFAEYGVQAIQTMRAEKPSEYIKTVASLMPKQLELDRPLQDLTDDDLAIGIHALQAYITANGLSEGTGAATVLEQAASVSSLH